jgi:transaldolase
MTDLANLKVKIFADGADKAGIIDIGKHPLIKGFTTNPTLMRKAGITDYEKFSREVLEVIGGRPISFEVFADDFSEMERQARLITTWGKNVYVKIPVTNTKREKANATVERLSKDGIALNVTALMTNDQVREVSAALAGGPHSYISVFAGRVADTGRDPVPLMAEALKIMRESAPKAELIWASPRELLNIFHADSIGCHVITVTNDILAKLKLVGKDLSDYSLETVQMFFKDGEASGFKL